MAAAARAAKAPEVIIEDGGQDVTGQVPGSIQRFADDDLVPRMMIPIAEAKARLAELRAFVSDVMTPEVHYGPPFPGSDKLVLYKAGGELLMEVYGYVVDVKVTDKIENWTAADGGPFFHYQVEARIYSKRTGNFIGRGIGSCNSRENRYRWRNGQRTCPNCGNETIIKGRAEYGGGFLCFAKKGGCGAKFKDDDPAITDQAVGKVPNDDVETLVNTILKIAKKRAYLDGAITVTQSSGLFAIEDDSDDADDETSRTGSGSKQRSATGTGSKKSTAGKGKPAQQAGSSQGAQQQADVGQQDEAHPLRVVIKGRGYWTAGADGPRLMRIWDLCRDYDKQHGKDAAKTVLEEVVGVTSSLDLNEEMADRVIEHMVDLLGGDANDDFPGGY